MAKEGEITTFIGPTEIMPGLDLSEMRRTVLMEGGLLTPRRKYGSKEERKAAARERSKSRREERRSYLESHGVMSEKRPKLSKSQKKVRSKEFRRIRNIYLRAHPSEAKALGIDLGRLRV